MVATTPLRVQLIAKREGGISGTSRYTRGIQQGLLEAGVEVALTFPAPPPLPGPLLAAFNRLGMDLATFFAGFPLRARLDNADVYHISAQTMATLLCFQRFPGPVVVTVLDIIPHLVRGDRELDTSRHAVERFFYRLAMAGLKRADALVAISEYTKRTLIQALGLPEERICVVYPAVDHGRFRPLDVPAHFRARYGLEEGGGTILYVGSDDPRKNLPTLLHAFAVVRQQLSGAELLLAGASQFPRQRQRLAGLVEAFGLGGQVRFLGRVPGEDLPLLYNLAGALAMPSLYEGFGLPVAEAMACGTPVVCSNATALPEVAGPAALLVSPRDPEAMAAALLRVLTDGDLAAKLRRQGLSQAAAFTPARVTAGLMGAYTSALAAPSGPRGAKS
jgi:glycosyltransferase involved in cell wall biosynthesis